MPNTVERPEPRALALLLGREERLEDPLARRGVHARAGVGHREHHVGAGHDAGVSRRVGGVELHVGRLDGQLASPRHGVASVHDEVHQDLLDLPGIGAHSSRGPARSTTASSTSSPTSRRSILATPPMTALRSRILGCRICCRLNARSWRVRSAARLPAADDLLQVVAHRVPRLEVRGEHLAVAEDDGQEVVEVVSDAPGEVPDGLHLLGLPELHLHPVALGHVHRDGEHRAACRRGRTCGP